MRLERDCRVVAPMYQTTPPTAAELFESYDTQLGSPQFGFGASAPAVRTRVAIIDSSVEETALGRPAHGASDHGFVVGSVAHRNSCMRSPAGEIGCTAFVSNHLGLPLGGNSAHGYPSDVGSAIYRAVVAWKAPPQAQPNLIVNLSLGWDASYGAAPGPKMRMGSLAAYLAAQFATCEGAMLVAAAGNESQPASPSGPLYPAGWELDDASCPVSSIYGSVLFSVGVVDGQDRTLGIAREGATPRMVAPGAFAVSQARNPVTGAPMGETEMLTGTSISAASVSGVAAMVWAMQPSLTATDVMNEVYRQAVTLHPIADFQHAPLNWSVRRLSACQAVMDVCAPGSCPIGCVPRPARSDARPDFALVVDSEYPGLVAAPTVAIITRLGAIPTGADVLEQPWAGPQPGVDPCPVCGYMGQNLMGRLEIPPGAVLTSLVVRPEPAVVAEGFSIQLEHQDAPFNIDMAYAFDIAAIDKATIEVTTLTNGKEVVRTSELFIEP